MPRIEDIGAFNAVRETGMAKLVPSIPRIAIGMGTCGRGNEQRACTMPSSRSSNAVAAIFT
jgi:hypothetical protein